MVLADVSESIPRSLRKAAQTRVQELVDQSRKPEDRLGIITVAEDVSIAAKPGRESTVQIGDHSGETSGSNLAAGMRMAMSMLPEDTANRILLISDGNETEQSLVEAAEAAVANGIPIEVMPLQYAHENEVILDVMKMPSRVREGQSVDLRLFIRSQSSNSGTLYLWQNESP
ncbi:MAG: VWA domain-containing protein, partial [Fuerstiella sp.]|nr:VWA domain-containing protein [Fuerstiella sp.]